MRMWAVTDRPYKWIAIRIVSYADALGGSLENCASPAVLHLLSASRGPGSEEQQSLVGDGRSQRTEANFSARRRRPVSCQCRRQAEGDTEPGRVRRLRIESGSRPQRLQRS